MRFCKRIVAALTILLSTVGLLASLAVGIGVWVVKGPVTAKATHVFERVEGALDLADQALQHARTSLDRAAERLANGNKEQSQLAREPSKKGVAVRFLVRTVQERVAPELGDVHEKLHTVAEAAVAVNSILEDLGNFPPLAVSGLDLERLAEINNRIAEVGPRAWGLSRLLGNPGPQADQDAATQLSRIEQALKTIRGMLAEYEPQLAEVRQRTERLKAMTLPWITPAAVVVSVVCFWIGLSQVSLFCHACSWWRRS
jgi:hypothetical protein